MQNTTVITKFVGFEFMLITGAEASPESSSDLDPADIFNLECLLLGEQGVTPLMSNEPSEPGMK